MNPHGEEANGPGKVLGKVSVGHIHSKNWFRWFPETAEKLEFSAERLSENAKTVNFSMCVRNKGQEEGLLPFYS